MTKKYCYFFTRQDISKEQQLVQTAHVAYKLGSILGKDANADLGKDANADETYFTCIGVRDLVALDAIMTIVNDYKFSYEAFFEPDLNEGEYTAIALYPIDETKRGILMAFNLLKM